MRTIRTLLVLLLTAALLTGTIASSAFAGTPGADLTGTWQGAITMPQAELAFTITFQAGPDGVSGSMNIPAQGVTGLPVSGIILEGTAFTAELPAAGGAKLHGVLAADGASIEGQYTQQGVTFPFRLVRQAASAAPAPAPAPAPAEIPAAGSLAGLDAYITGLLDEWNVPGLAVGVIHKGEVVFAKGFGLRNLEQALPVTTETVFPLASTSKAFTALAFQILAEEGRLDWDRPVREYLPGFRMYDLFATERVTARDWAVHRTGLARQDVPFIFNPDLDARTFVANLRHIEPMYEFRTRYNYDSTGYVILSHLLEEATGRPWSEVVRDRILLPLGMNQTSFTVEALQQAADHAAAYMEIDGKLSRVEYMPTRAIAGGGAMNASVADMLKWVRFQLGTGRVGDKQVVSQSGLAETQSPQIVIHKGPGNQTSYALGWRIESYQGHHTVSHTGATLGSASHVTFLPADQIGVVVLGNSYSGIPHAIITQTVLDRLLGLEARDWNAFFRQALDQQVSAAQPVRQPEGSQSGASPSHPLTDYAGEYHHPAYGSLQVRQVGEALEATYYTTTMPLKHKHFDQFSGPLSPMQPLNVSFRFTTGASGAVTEVVVDFEGQGNELTFTKTVDSAFRDPAYLQRMAGVYTLAGSQVEVVLSGTELVLRLPGQVPYPLVPVSSGRFHLKGMPTLTLTFIMDEGGSRATGAWISESENAFEMVRVD